jgi:chromosome segregation ATPase
MADTNAESTSAVDPQPTEQPSAEASQQGPVTADVSTAEVDAEIAELEAQIKRATERAEHLEQEDAKKEQARNRDGLRTQLSQHRRELSETERETADVEEKLAKLQPEYERAMTNRDLLDRRDSCKRDIDSAESELAAQQAENARLETELERVSSKYKETRELRASFVESAADLLNKLHEVVVFKIKNTVDSDEVAANAFESLELMSDLVREREAEIANNTSLLREIEATIALKKETAESLESDCESTVNNKRRERAETIKRLIYGFQEERNTLHADIEEVRRVNAEQAANLQRGHIDRGHRDPDAFKPEKEMLSPSGRRKPVKRVTSVKSDSDPTPEERLIASKNNEVEAELNETLGRVAEAQRQKTELLKSQKTVKLQMTADRSAAENRVRAMEAQVVAEVERVRKLNAENARLADTVKHLTDVVRVTKRQVEHIRGHTAPLPIEED